MGGTDATVGSNDASTRFEPVASKDLCHNNNISNRNGIVSTAGGQIMPSDVTGKEPKKILPGTQEGERPPGDGSGPIWLEPLVTYVDRGGLIGARAASHGIHKGQ